MKIPYFTNSLYEENFKTELANRFSKRKKVGYLEKKEGIKPFMEDFVREKGGYKNALELIFKWIDEVDDDVRAYYNETKKYVDKYKKLVEEKDELKDKLKPS